MPLPPQAWAQLDGRALIEAVANALPGKVAAIASFGPESAVLLDLVAQVDRALPVLLIDTGELFDETLAYRHTLERHLGLSDVRVVRPSAAERAEAEALWRSNPDRCCALRKVAPFGRAAAGFAALIDGRKRSHGFGREALARVEAGSGPLKISPLATWSGAEVEAAFVARGLPRHPLAARGYRSVGCRPCTRPTGADEPARAGRWSGLGKSECGIHTTLATVAGRNLFAVEHQVTQAARARANGHKGGVVWLTGLSGSGKSILAMELERRLFLRGWQATVLDGDNVRHGLCADLGFSPADRAENIRRVGEVAHLFAQAGMLAITAFISPYRADRDRVRAIAPDAFHEVFVATQLTECERRDPKGLYRKARLGQIPEFTGVSAPYEPPSAPDLVIDTAGRSLEESVAELMAYVEARFGAAVVGAAAE
ncbi:adenylyl-sulfate kinase [Magnetospirillum sp. UT-4]|uniref:adenylyl-sulfate kinase n=1 Tax=Magnetospirillum sp. UT-4 TaxID=2681467 RepID=UPI00137D47C5|nr:adenylyl-sulfate kinase [Magnetospirillum sp. UT-4]CAA7611307.1 adenosine 5'-phosphosulfate kinase (modular protein) [Magnetospirillum sp. UT-4]